MLYALSTCGWCKKTRELLANLEVEYDYEYVDLLIGEDKKKAVQTVTHWNPSCSFPTLIIDDRICIVGFEEAKIREALK
jgi:glutaredoxin-like protein NrdH